MPTTKLLNRAESELTDSCIWYEKQQKGLSKLFRKEISSVLKGISSNPYLYNYRYGTDLRFAALNQFPFVLIYWFNEEAGRYDFCSINFPYYTKRNPKF